MILTPMVGRFNDVNGIIDGIGSGDLTMLMDLNNNIIVIVFGDLTMFRSIGYSGNIHIPMEYS